MSKRTSVSEIIEEETAIPGSPRRRSTRIAASQKPSSEEVPAKITRSRRSSSIQDDNSSRASTPIMSNTRKSVTRSMSRSPSSIIDGPARRTRSASTSSATEEQVVLPPKITLKRRLSTETATGTPTKTTRSKTEMTNVKPPATSTPSKVRGRRTSITEKLTPMEAIKELESKVDVQNLSTVEETSKKNDNLPLKKKVIQKLQTINEKGAGSTILDDEEIYEPLDTSKVENKEKPTVVLSRLSLNLNSTQLQQSVLKKQTEEVKDSLLEDLQCFDSKLEEKRELKAAKIDNNLQHVKSKNDQKSEASDKHNDKPENKLLKSNEIDKDTSNVTTILKTNNVSSSALNISGSSDNSDKENQQQLQLSFLKSLEEVEKRTDEKKSNTSNELSVEKKTPTSKKRLSENKSTNLNNSLKENISQESKSKSFCEPMEVEYLSFTEIPMQKTSENGLNNSNSQKSKDLVVMNVNTSPASTDVLKIDVLHETANSEIITPALISADQNKLNSPVRRSTRLLNQSRSDSETDKSPLSSPQEKLKAQSGDKSENKQLQISQKDSLQLSKENIHDVENNSSLNTSVSKSTTSKVEKETPTKTPGKGRKSIDNKISLVSVSLLETKEKNMPEDSNLNDKKCNNDSDTDESCLLISYEKQTPKKSKGDVEKTETENDKQEKRKSLTHKMLTPKKPESSEDKEYDQENEKEKRNSKVKTPKGGAKNLETENNTQEKRQSMSHKKITPKKRESSEDKESDQENEKEKQKSKVKTPKGGAENLETENNRQEKRQSMSHKKITPKKRESSEDIESDQENEKKKRKSKIKTPKGGAENLETENNTQEKRQSHKKITPKKPESSEDKETDRENKQEKRKSKLVTPKKSKGSTENEELDQSREKLENPKSKAVTPKKFEDSDEDDKAEDNKNRKAQRRSKVITPKTSENDKMDEKCKPKVQTPKPENEESEEYEDFALHEMFSKKSRNSNKYSETEGDIEEKQKSFSAKTKIFVNSKSFGGDTENSETEESELDISKEKKIAKRNRKSDLDSKIDKLLQEISDGDSDTTDESVTHYLDDMAEEGEEDTPSEDSNAIIDEGESVGSTVSEIDSDESYDLDSFIDDTENIELLSGEEYDLNQEKSRSRKTEKKGKWKRLIQNTDDSSDDEEIPQLVEVGILHNNQSPKENVTNDMEKRQEDADFDLISTQAVCSSTPSVDSVSETNVLINKNDNLKSLEEIKETSIHNESNSNVEISNISPLGKRFSTSKYTPNNTITENISSPSSQTKRKRLSSLNIQENISLKDIEDANVSDHITNIINVFCSNVKQEDRQRSGSISLNISLDYTTSPKREDSNESLPIIPQHFFTESKDKSMSNEFSGPIITISDDKVEEMGNNQNLVPSVVDSDQATEQEQPKKKKKKSKPKIQLQETVVNVEVPTLELEPKKKQRNAKKAKDSSKTIQIIEDIRISNDSLSISHSNKLKKDEFRKKSNDSNKTGLKSVEVSIKQDQSNEVLPKKHSNVSQKKQKQSKLKVADPDNSLDDDVFELQPFKLQLSEDSIDSPDVTISKKKKRKHVENSFLATSSTTNYLSEEQIEKLTENGGTKSKKIKREASVTVNPTTFENNQTEKTDSVKLVPSTKRYEKDQHKKGHKIRLVPTAKIADTEWESKMTKARLKPTSSKTKKVDYSETFSTKDFKNKMLYNPGRVDRMESKSLLKKKEKMKKH